MGKVTLAGKVALVTGASSGIGQATAARLAQRGAQVYACARRVEKMASLADVGVEPMAMDVTDDASMSDGVGRVVDRHGRLDILVNNAGYGLFGALEDVPLTEARRQFEVNLFGLARLTQLALPHMRAGGFGRIVNVSSIGGKIWEPFGSWYHSSKFAVEGLSDCLRLELREFGIPVVLIEPGMIKTEWGGIMTSTLRQHSGKTVYADLFDGYVSKLSQTSLYDSIPGSDPDVVARAIVKAVTANRPRARYATGSGARPMLLAARWLPNKAYDAAWAAALRFMARHAAPAE
ncbi:MAG: SDR family NAD(P)-dependent oxidoreductase [Bifidobacteriaceae bacterium]|jgi:NAD(P)-dependent dehydrogenase (short-subunit alcohol dehydrogenase family)|nr:SDR family NAD(P)-dependent oxidoreductase [Bifidobacteriaceae bacterium]